MKRYLSLVVITLLIFTFAGCSNQTPDVPDTEDENNNVGSNYNITKEVIEIEERNTKVFYPQVTDFPGELLMDYMNQSLKTVADIYANDEFYKDANLDYKITLKNENILSVLFKGTANIAEIGKINIQQSISLDMNSSNEITYDNLINSKEEVMQILDEKAKEQGLETGVESEGMHLYFNNEDIVFYYMPLDDSAKEFVELSVPEKEIKEYLNTDFGEAPAS